MTYGFAVERSIAYDYLPPHRAAIGTRGEVEVFGEWVVFEVNRAALGSRRGEDPGLSLVRRSHRTDRRPGRPKRRDVNRRRRPTPGRVDRRLRGAKGRQPSGFVGQALRSAG